MSTHSLTSKVRPFMGESLFSLMIRAAEENGLSICELLNMNKVWLRHYFQSKEVHNIDFAPTGSLNLDFLAKLLLINKEELLNLTLSNLLAAFKMDTRLSRSRFTAGMIRDILHFCPQCLKEKPFLRLLWRLQGVSCCHIHKVILKSSCEKCHRQISYEDISSIQMCSYCEFLLEDSPPQNAQQDVLKADAFYTNCWEVLLNLTDYTVNSSKTAFKLLYILNGLEDEFDKDYVKSRLADIANYSALLQQARGTVYAKRVIHLNTIFKVLELFQISMQEFLSIDVPEPFMVSILEIRKTILSTLSCRAPWCKNYGMNGTLQRTPTSLKKYIDGKYLKYFLVCPLCGCEYALDESGQIHERSYFIKVYKLLSKYPKEQTSVKGLSRIADLSEDQIKRAMAYFEVRNVFGNTTQIELELLDEVLEALVNRIALKDIRKWECWNSYNHYLHYRFHPKVMEAIQSKTNQRDKDKKAAENGRILVSKVLDKLYLADRTITLKTVSEEIGVCPETIRYWGCNQIISQYKERQRQNRLIAQKEQYNKLVEDYLEKNNGFMVTAPEIYKVLGIKRQLLWRFAPELTKSIHNRLTQHNQAAKLKPVSI